MRRDIRDYYSSRFDLEKLAHVFSFDRFSQREFGFVSLTGKFFRNISFENSKALSEFLIDRTPIHAYIGAIFNESPSRETPIHMLEWRGHELVFDIDLNEYDTVRKYVCDCQGADQVCTHCWQLINLAIYIIDESLRFDFGLEKIHWLFSGRRGIHGWVLDHVALELNQEQRKSIVDYFSVIHGEGETARIQDRNKLMYDFRKRVERTVLKFFLQGIRRRKDLLDLGFKSNKATEIMKQLEFQEGKIDENLAKTVNFELAKINKYDEIMRRWLPRIDHKVTIDLRRLIRLPYSIHGKTGKIARIMNPSDIFSFNPEKESSIYSFQ